MHGAGMPYSPEEELPTVLSLLGSLKAAFGASNGGKLWASTIVGRTRRRWNVMWGELTARWNVTPTCTLLLA
jgi:hypothetical protein